MYLILLSIDDVNYKYAVSAENSSSAIVKCIEELQDEIGGNVEIKIKITRKVKE